MENYTPFCGAPPIPADLWGRWLFDPALLAGLALLLAGGLWVAQDRRRFAIGWVVVALLFISPLCAASIALFSARVGQHILLTLVAAPIIAAALPALRLPALPLAVLFAVLFWFWHAPVPYQATLMSDAIYWAMHISLFGAAVVLFAALRAAPERGLPAAALTGAQMTLFAMLLTLAPAPWHGWHLATTTAYGLSALADQQLAGGLMWVAGGALFMVSIAGLALRFLNDSGTEPDPTDPR